MAEGTENTALAKIDSYQIAKMTPAELAATMAENLGDEGLSVTDLDRVTVPSGGNTTWTIPGIEGETEEKVIEGVIVFRKDRRQYWVKSMEDSGGAPPNCVGRQELVGISMVWRGHGIPNREDPTLGGRDDDGFLGPYDCSTCPFDQFGSARSGRGKACKNEVDVFVLRENALLPLVLKCSPASIKKLSDYMKGLTKKGLPYWGVVTAISLNKIAKSDNGRPAYSEIVFTMVEPVPSASKPRLKSYVDSVRDLLEASEKRAAKAKDEDEDEDGHDDEDGDYDE